MPELEPDELAYKIDDRYFAIQRTEEGYDYTFYALDYDEIDGGAYDNPDISMRQAMEDILEDEDVSLENAVSDYSLSKKTAKHTTQYYEAVNNVQEQLAKKNQELREKAETKTTEAKSSQKKAEIKTAETKSTEKKIKVKTVKNMQKQSQKDIKKVAKSQIKLTESVSKSQQLVVTLQLDETGGYPQYYIQKWKLCSSDDWQADDSLDVYQSGE